MKKLLCAISALAMVFAFAACGSKNEEKETSSAPAAATTAEPESSSGYDIAGLFSGGKSDVIFSKLSAGEKLALLRQADAEDIDVAFQADGSTEFKHKDGIVVVQKSDGTITVKGNDGHEGQLGGEWPDNEYTKLIPKPAFTIAAAAVEDDSFDVIFSDATVDLLKEYVKEIKDAGFDDDIDISDSNAYGAAVYAFSASNHEGYEIEVYYSAGVCGLSIHK